MGVLKPDCLKKMLAGMRRLLGPDIKKNSGYTVTKVLFLTLLPIFSLHFTYWFGLVLLTGQMNVLC